MFLNVQKLHIFEMFQLGVEGGMGVIADVALRIFQSGIMLTLLCS